MSIPAEHLTKLQAATDDQLRQVQEHNRKRADQDWAAGRHGEARQWYAYVDACQAILDERTYGPVPIAPDVATPAQVDYIIKLLVRRTSEAGFSGIVATLHNNGTADVAAIRRLTKARASEVIDSLTERY